jgi:hypothetical protein
MEIDPTNPKVKGMLLYPMIIQTEDDAVVCFPRNCVITITADPEDYNDVSEEDSLEMEDFLDAYEAGALGTDEDVLFEYLLEEEEDEDEEDDEGEEWKNAI